MTTTEANAPRSGGQSWEAVFPLIRDDWTRVQVEDWTLGFAVAQAEYDLLQLYGLWRDPPADFFWVVGISRKEHQHSRMLAWLMDPGQGHGLGDGFLARVLALCVPKTKPSKMRVHSVEREVMGSTPEGQSVRADIVVRGETDRPFSLVIENKVDADEGDDQCKKLYESFKGTGAHFMFLSPGSGPTTDTELKFNSVTYQSVILELEAALADAPGVLAPDRRLAEDYLRTLRREFG